MAKYDDVENEFNDMSKVDEHFGLSSYQFLYYLKYLNGSSNVFSYIDDMFIDRCEMLNYKIEELNLSQQTRRDGFEGNISNPFYGNLYTQIFQLPGYLKEMLDTGLEYSLSYLNGDILKEKPKIGTKRFTGTLIKSLPAYLYGDMSLYYQEKSVIENHYMSLDYNVGQYLNGIITYIKDIVYALCPIHAGNGISENMLDIINIESILASSLNRDYTVSRLLDDAKPSVTMEELLHYLGGR